MSTNHCELIDALHKSLCHAVEALGQAVKLVDCKEHHHNHEGIYLPFGEHTIQVKVDCIPREVFVSVQDECGPVCGGDISTVATSLLEDGFVLYVNVKSNEALVKWIVKD